MKSAVLLAVGLCWAVAAPAAPGDPDTAFGVSGAATFPVGRSGESVSAVLPQVDGRVVAVGVSAGQVALARYNPDGSLDASFGSGGLSRRPMPVGIPISSGAALRQPDGRIVVGAICSGGPCLARFEANGALDPTFDSTPVAVPSFIDVSGFRLGMAPDGRMLVAVRTGSGVRLYRFLRDGGLDSAFGSGGYVATAQMMLPGAIVARPDGALLLVGSTVTSDGGIVVQRFSSAGEPESSFPLGGGTYAAVRAAILQPDGKLVIGGTKSDPSIAPAALLMRMLPDGSLDPGFGGGTGITQPFASESLVVTSLALRPDGRIAASFARYSSPQAGFHVLQLDPAGALDASFGSGGRLTFEFSANSYDSAESVALLPDGRLILGGGTFGSASPSGDFALARLTAGGALDPAFGAGGLVTSEFHGGGRGSVVDIREQGGKLVVLAALEPAGAGEYAMGEVGLARLLADGTLDPTLAGRGHLDATLGRAPTSLGFTRPQARALALQADGKALVAGQGTPTVGVRSAIVMRFALDGSVDTTFAADGRRRILDGAFAAAVEVQPDGRIVVAGKVFSASQPSQVPTRMDAFVARLHPDGTPDTTFGAPGGNGIVIVPSDDNESSQQRMTLIVQPDGKLVVSGVALDGLSALRLNADGSVDSSFARFAMVYPAGGPFLGPPTRSRAAMVHADGRVTVAGFTPGTSDCLAPDGPMLSFARVDASGGGGPQTPGLGFMVGTLRPRFPVVEAGRLDARDRVVAVGSRYVSCTVSNSSPPQARRGAMVMRFTPLGALDLAFGNNGVVAIDAVGSASAVHISETGRILAGMSTVTSHDSVSLLAFQGGGDSAPSGLPYDVDGDGLMNASEFTFGRDPFVQDNDIFADARLFAMQQYRDFLGREGESAGVDFWTAQLANGTQTRAQMAETFFNSAEFQGLAAPIARLYFAYFLRIPDYGGLDFWISRYRTGSSLEGISNAFAASPEFAATYGVLDNAGFVDRVYRNVLGRAPDAGGFAYWKGRIDAGMTRGQLMVEFSESPEYRSLIGNEVSVTMMYVGMLRRAPDAGGFAYWVSYLDAGNSGLALTGAFLAAPEYRARFLP